MSPQGTFLRLSLILLCWHLICLITRAQLSPQDFQRTQPFPKPGTRGQTPQALPSFSPLGE